nr:ABC transporter substrate binding protein [uncultured Desulfobacter sp.]
MKTKLKIFSILICLCQLAAVVYAADQHHAARFKVLVVMSYGADYGFAMEEQQGIESVLSDTCRIEYAYLDTRKNVAGGPQKAKEAYELYKRMRPDGVIAADDNAQSMFVVPYLKDKVNTPVMFCGVNKEPETYGYPAANVSGILERVSISQTLAFAKLLMPAVKTFGYMSYDGTTGRSILDYSKHEEHTLPLKLAAVRFPKTLTETRAMAGEMRPLCDILYISSMQGTKDDDGTPLSAKQVVPVLTAAFAKPVVGCNNLHVKYGMLCGMTQTPQEQGATAAQMLLKAMGGTPVSQIPITRNRRNKPIINVTVMEAFDIKPKPILLKDTELVRTEL